MQLPGLVQFLETIVDPVAAALRNAPLDEPETEEDKLAAAARDWLRKNGRGRPSCEAMRRFGLD